MRTVLFVISNLEYGGAARQLMLLAAGLPRETFRIRVLVLGTETPWTEALRAEGGEVETLGWRRPFDVLPFLELRRRMRSQRPEVVHVWGAAALRAVVLSGSRRVNRLLVSAVLTPATRPSHLDRWLLRRVAGAIAFGATDAERYRRVGVPNAHITVAAPAVLLPAETGERAELPGIAPGERILVGVGPIEQHKGFREGVWAFDILKHFYGDLHLVLAGVGPDRPRVEQFARDIGIADHVHFPGACADLAPLLRRAEVVWVPSLRGGGAGVALEAMAAGRPVVATRCPDLAEIVVDGETGFLIEPNNKAALARQTRLLLDDAARRQLMGGAGRRRVAEDFTVAGLVETCTRRYAVE